MRKANWNFLVSNDNLETNAQNGKIQRPFCKWKSIFTYST